MGKILNGLKWTAAEKFSLQIVQFVLGIIIARLISPTEYGILGILLVFINVPQVFIDSGLGNALIYKNTIEDKSLQTTFTFNLAVSAAFYVLVFFLAPYIETFYNLPKLSLYIRVTSLVLLTNSLVVVPTAILKIRLNFRTLSLANIYSTVTSGAIGVVMAYLGWGIWALIGQLMSKSILLSLILVFNCKWIPNFTFSKKAFLPLYRYGINVFLTSLVTKITEEGISFIIAKKLSPYSLGIYTRGKQFASFSQTSFTAIVTTVMFPSLSSIKDDEQKFHRIFKESLEYQAAISIPLWVVLFFLSEPLILLLLTQKWVAVIPVLQIISIGKIISLLPNVTEQAFMAKGRPDVFFKQQMIKMGVKLVAILVALPFGLLWVVAADAITTFIYFFITNHFVKYIGEQNYGTLPQLKMTLPYIISSIVACGLSYLAMLPIHNNLLRIILFSIAFLLLYYIIIDKLLKKKIFESLIKSLIR